MGVVIRQSIKATIVSYAGTVIGYVNILILFPLFLSTEQIGLYRVLTDAASFFVIFSLLGTTDTTVKFLPYFKDGKNQHNGFLPFLILTVMFGFILFLIGYFTMYNTIMEKFTEKSPLLVDYANYLIPLTFMMLFYNLFMVYARALLRIVIPRIIKEFLVRVLLALGIILYAFNIINFTELIVWMVLIYTVALVLLIWYVHRLGHLFLKPNYRVFKSPVLKEMIVFGLITILASGSGIIVGKIDTLMLGSMSGLDAAGVYGIAFYMAAIIQMPRRNLADISTPIVANAFKSGNLEKVKEIYQKTSINLFIMGAFLLTGIWTNIDSIFLLIPNSASFISGKYVVLFIGLAKLIDMSMGSNSEIITNSKFYRWNLLFLPLLAILTVVSNLILIPKYGIIGAALASFISMTINNILRFFFLIGTLKIHPVTIDTLKALLIGIAGYALASLLPTIDNVYLDILQRGGLVVITYFILLSALKPSPEIDMLLKNGLSKMTKLFR